ncbi:retrovirus-related pol polyprotein from transposon TNT 1-94 [Tanacetum coccineum]
MSTCNTHQQSLADASYETRPPMLKRGGYRPWASRFRRYLNRKRENRKWLNKAIDDGPYEFKEFTPFKTEPPRMQKEEDFKGYDLKHYEADIEAMNLIIISIQNDIYNSYVTQVRLAKRLTKDTYDDLFDYLQQFKKLVNASRAKKLEKSHDPLVLVAHTGSSSKTTTPYYVTHHSSVVDYDDDYQGDAVENNSEDPLTSAIILLARAITQRFSTPTNNHLRTSSNTRNQAIVQEKIVKGNNVQNDAGIIQRNLRTTSSGIAANVQCYNCSEKGHYARNCPKPRVQDLKYFMEQILLAKQDEAGVILTDEHNDFLFADDSRMEEIKELSANICLMTRIQPTNFNSDEGPSYDSAFLSEQPKIINNTIGDDQIDRNIIFDEPNGDVNSGSVDDAVVGNRLERLDHGLTEF